MSNNDEQMRRFLFAILKQKSLKDIDWNLVAKDPVLLQPISNGHAARMRYSRFRQQMLGLESQKRGRSSSGKDKVTKIKKEEKPKRHSEASLSPDDTKEDPTFDTNPHAFIKMEHERRFSQNQFSPASIASPSTFSSNECPSGSTGRLPTPSLDDLAPFYTQNYGTTLPPDNLYACCPRDIGTSILNDMGVDLMSAEEENSQHSLSYQRGSWAQEPYSSAFDAAMLPYDT